MLRVHEERRVVVEKEKEQKEGRGGEIKKPIKIKYIYIYYD